MESILNYLVLLVVGALIVWYDTRLFALYSFAVIVGLIIHFSGRLWKLIRVSHASNAGKLLVIAKKLGVSDSDFDHVVAESRTKDPNAWAALERDLKDL